MSSFKAKISAGGPHCGSQIIIQLIMKKEECFL